MVQITGPAPARGVQLATPNVHRHGPRVTTHVWVHNSDMCHAFSENKYKRSQMNQAAEFSHTPPARGAYTTYILTMRLTLEEAVIS